MDPFVVNGHPFASKHHPDAQITEPRPFMGDVDDSGPQRLGLVRADRLYCTIDRERPTSLQAQRTERIVVAYRVSVAARGACGLAAFSAQRLFRA